MKTLRLLFEKVNYGPDGERLSRQHFTIDMPCPDEVASMMTLGDRSTYSAATLIGGELRVPEGGEKR